MFHKLSARSATSNPSSTESRIGLHIATPRDASTRPALSDAGPGLPVIVARRCSSFLAEAAVLVLVFGILDYLMLKGRIELSWIAGAIFLSLGLLAASIVLDMSAHRWIKAHP